LIPSRRLRGRARSIPDTPSASSCPLTREFRYRFRQSIRQTDVCLEKSRETRRPSSLQLGAIFKQSMRQARGFEWEGLRIEVGRTPQDQDRHYYALAKAKHPLCDVLCQFRAPLTMALGR